jgi:CRISPR-associated protein Cst2
MVANEKGTKEKPAKRDSVLRMNLAVALSPYRFDATFHQSPQNAGKSPWKNAGNSALLHREVAYTAYQYPFALAGADCAASTEGIAWSQKLLQAIAQLANVAGGHARSYFEMAPRSIVARLTPNLVAGFDTYGFDEKGGFRDLERVHAKDLPGREMWIGGALARDLGKEARERLLKEGVHLEDNPQALLDALGRAMFVEA